MGFTIFDILKACLDENQLRERVITVVSAGTSKCKVHEKEVGLARSLGLPVRELDIGYMDYEGAHVGKLISHKKIWLIYSYSQQKTY